ncbi:hypothetical protein COM84_21095 [Bacillus thuringiensis]|nr:hypothetical protein COM84_21095 [Bacillus thuringiensis]
MFKVRVVYFWISKVNEVHNIEFNLGAKYRFSYENETSTLKAELNESFIPNFYQLPTVEKNIDISVNAIIGENGTGKTSILETIRDMLGGLNESQYLFIIETKQGYQYCSNIKSINIKGINMFNRGRSAKNIKRIFYSNVFDSRSLQKQIQNHHTYQDVTTNTLIKNFKGVQWYLSKELADQIYFCMNFQKKQLGEYLKIPQNIQLSLFETNLENHFPKLMREYINELSKLENTTRIFVDFTTTDTYKRSIENNITKNFYSFYLKQVLKYYFLEINDYIKSLYTYAQYNTIMTSFYEEYYKILESFIQRIRLGNLDSPRLVLKELIITAIKKMKKHSKFTLDANEFRDFLERLEGKVSILLKLLINNTIQTRYSTRGVAKLVDLSSEIVDIFVSWKKYMLGGLVWTELSSGEYAMMSMFSRIYSAKKSLNVNYKETMTLILIDEGDLYFHPQWQKEWLFILLEGLNEIFEDQMEEEVQVLLTTHSPFILSDIPSDRVLLLKKGPDGQSVIVGNQLEDNPLTWGANIHSLYANSFFLTDGLMGNFAKVKINHLIYKLINKSSEQIRDCSLDIRNTINLIGEPVLKNKLIELYQQKISLLQPETKMIHEEMKLLRERLYQLEKLVEKRGEKK